MENENLDVAAQLRELKERTRQALREAQLRRDSPGVHPDVVRHYATSSGQPVALSKATDLVLRLNYRANRLVSAQTVEIRPDTPDPAPAGQPKSRPRERRASPRRTHSRSGSDPPDDPPRRCVVDGERIPVGSRADKLTCSERCKKRLQRQVDAQAVERERRAKYVRELIRAGELDPLRGLELVVWPPDRLAEVAA
jgi:predicted nucleic acid-binding Zn ribbon protein